MTFEVRATPAFSAIDISDDINVILTTDSSESIRVEGGENLINFIITEVRDTTLFIYNTNSCNYLRSLKKETNVYVSFRSLNAVYSRGYGNITCTDTIRASNFTYEQRSSSGSAKLLVSNDSTFLHMYDGTGDLEVSGTTNVAHYYQNAVGFLDARDLYAKRMWVEHQSVSDVHVWCWGRLVALINHTGDMFYYHMQPLVIIEYATHTGHLNSAL